MINGHYIHLLSNHFPIILSLTGFIVLTIGLLRHSKIVKQVGLCILLAASIATIPAYISGEEAEHTIENSLLLLTKEHSFSVWANRLTWLAALISILLLFNVGKTGGQIRRPELRNANTIDTLQLQNNKEAEEEND